MQKILDSLMARAKKAEGFLDVNLNDKYFADYIARASGGLIRQSSSWGWLVYDESRGVFESSDRAGKIVRLYISEMAKLLVLESGMLGYDGDSMDRRKAILKFCNKILNANGHKAVETELKNPVCLHADPNEFDKDPYLLNCGGVAVDLKTGAQRKATPDDMFMKSAGVKPMNSLEEAVKAAPVFMRFIQDITCKQSDLQKYLMYFLGYSLSGDMKEQCFLNFYGPKGMNGKSTILDLCRYIWGDYAMEAPESVVIKMRDDRRFDTANIMGARLLIRSDIPEGSALNTENMKNISGGDTMTAEKKHHDGFQFKPVCKIILSSNYRLRLPEAGDYMERRIRLMPFNADFRNNRDREMGEKLKAEAPAILTILIEYARRWYKEGLPVSEIIKSTSAEYLLDEDAIRQFVAEKCVRGDGEAVSRSELYAAFCGWTNARKPPTPKAFKDKMASRGYSCEKYRKRDSALYNISCFMGLRLLKDGEKKPEEQADLIFDDPAMLQNEDCVQCVQNLPIFSFNPHEEINIESNSKTGQKLDALDANWTQDNPDDYADEEPPF